ncbi:hypothetical protein ACROYT_G002115 [Oculina patagonica]
METEHRLTAPPQLTTLTRLDQDMKQIMDSSLAEDQKVMLLDHLLRRYQGLTKQMKSETSIKPAVVLPKTDPAPPKETITNVNSPASTPKVKTTRETPRQLPPTPATTKQSKIPVRMETPLNALPEESAYAIMMETPPDSKRKSVKRLKKTKTPLVARLWQDLLDILDFTAPENQDWIDDTSPEEQEDAIIKAIIYPDEFGKTCWYWLDLIVNGVDEVDR